MDWMVDQFLRNVLGHEPLANAFAWVVIVAFLMNLALCVRIIWVKGSRPNAALAWMATLFALPILGFFLYLIIGENRIGTIRRRRHAKIMKAVTKMGAGWKDPRVHSAWMSDTDKQMEHLALHSGAPAVLNGNTAELSGDPAEQLRWMVADIDAATKTVDLLFYIYLNDQTGQTVSSALVRAAQRGVSVRLLVDSIGSHLFMKSAARKALAQAGVTVREALPASFLRMLVVRADIRNHRKLIVVDGCIAQTGSRNIADPDFKCADKPGKSDPYVDSWMRICGPVVRDLYMLFLEDWGLEQGLPRELPTILDPAVQAGGFGAQVIPSGPNFENSVVLSLMQGAIQLARREIVLTTPYFIPDISTISALQVAARRGIRVTVIVPRASDSKLAALASRANYERMLKAGVELWEFKRGFLHSKTITVDNELAIITTANLDRRSYEINFETSVVIYDNRFTEQTRKLQTSYLADSDRIDLRVWMKRGMKSRFAENLSNLVSPLL